MFLISLSTRSIFLAGCSIGAAICSIGKARCSIGTAGYMLSYGVDFAAGYMLATASNMLGVARYMVYVILVSAQVLLVLTFDFRLGLENIHK